jgi:hypothetical protein
VPAEDHLCRSAIVAGGDPRDRLVVEQLTLT